jgi:ParB family chromosome partitioning protein
MQNCNAFQFIAVDQIHESTTNPRETFEASKLEELAESIRRHGLIHPLPSARFQWFSISSPEQDASAPYSLPNCAVPARIVEAPGVCIADSCSGS